MKKALTLLSCTLLIYSCASLKSLDINKISGLYQTESPCEDCRGIKTNILIKPDFSFEKTSLYLGKENNYLETKGNWKIENDSTISLNENGTQKHYRIRNNSLFNIDKDNKVVGNNIRKVDLDTKTEGDFSAQKAKRVHFFATGTEPFWSLEVISNKTLEFNLIGSKALTAKDIITTYKNGVISIKSKAKKPALEVTIYNYQCVNDMSGAVSSNYVEVKIDNQIYKGCGLSLNTDFKIAGKWNLKFIKDYNIPADNSGKKPFLSFNIQEKSINGHFGCNSFGGNYETNHDAGIKFSKVISTLMACKNMETESKFSAALQSTDSYKIVNNELQLYKGKELLLSFSR